MNLTVTAQLSKEYQLSKYIKNDMPYYVITLQMIDKNGNKFHHNVHYDDRVGGVSKELMNDFDQVLRDLIDLKTIGNKKIVIENVKPYNFTCSIANRNWILPTIDTKVKVIGMFTEEVIGMNGKKIERAIAA